MLSLTILNELAYLSLSFLFNYRHRHRHNISKEEESHRMGEVRVRSDCKGSVRL